MLKLTFYVPESHLNKVKSAVFQAGGGKIGNYDQCCWEVAGSGQFRPLEGSQPFLGKQNKVECVSEYRVEMVVDENSVNDVKQALLESHPYESPAYDFVQMLEC